MIVQTPNPHVPALVPRATADVSSPAQPCGIVSVSNLIFCWSNIFKSTQFLTLKKEMYLFYAFQLKYV